MSQADVLTPRKQPQQARARATVEAILEATARVLVDEGYERANTNRVAEVAGVGVGTLYQYFPGKGALVATLARRHAEEVLGLLAEHTSTFADAPPERAVRSFVQAMVEAHDHDPELHRVLVEQVPRLGGFDLMREMNDRAVPLVRAWCELHRDRLRVPDLDLAAYMVVITVQAAVHGVLLTEPARLHDPAFAEELSQLVLRYLLTLD